MLFALIVSTCVLVPNETWVCWKHEQELHYPNPMLCAMAQDNYEVRPLLGLMVQTQCISTDALGKKHAFSRREGASIKKHALL